MRKIISLLIVIVAVICGGCLAFADDSAFYLIDDAFSFLVINDDLSIVRPPSGWEVDQRGGTLASSYYNWFRLIDNKEDSAIVLKRKFPAQDSGKLTLEAVFTPLDMENGLFYKLTGADETIMKIVTNGQNFCYLDKNNTPQKLIEYEDSIVYGLKAEIDIDSKMIDVYFQGQHIKQIPFLKEINCIDQLIISTPVEGTMSVNLSSVRVYKNFLVNEKFITTAVGNSPSDWDIKQLCISQPTVQELRATSPFDIKSLKIEDKSVIDKAVLTRKIENTNGVLCFEIKFLLPERADNIQFSLMNNEDTIVNVYTMGDYLYYGNKKILKEYSQNVWQTLRIEADININASKMRLNGKTILENVPFDKASNMLNAIKISTSTNGKCLLWIDDITVFKIPSTPDDYVVAPVVVESTDQIVGINSCHIWREGYHRGWDKISPFSGRKPYLGWFDEGRSEVADWEIKWLAEHGVDFEFHCWYLPILRTAVPMKDPTNAFALHEGYFNAKYKDKMKFAIQVCESGENIKGSKDFRENIVPFLIDYYLKDPQYMTIDNKPVIGFFSPDGLVKAFGSVENARIEMEYLRQVCRDIGFDGAIILFNTSEITKARFTRLKEIGADSIYFYSADHNMAGYNEPQKESLLKRQGIGVVDALPLVTMGYDDSPSQNRSGKFSTPQEFEEMLYWVKDEYMRNASKDALSSKLMFLGNWNELGEGHFIMPTELYGFGYLDSIRKVFTSNPEHIDPKPTVEQQEQMGQLYPQDRKALKLLSGVPKVSSNILKGWNFNNEDDIDDWKVEKQIIDLHAENGSLIATSTGLDPSLVMKEDILLDITSVKYIKLRVRQESTDSSLSIYFTTKDDNTWSQEKCVKAVAYSKEFEDYYFYVGTNKAWKGILKKLRFDPMASEGKFFLQSIELLADDFNISKVSIDGEIQKFDVSPKTIDGTLFVPIRNLFNKYNAYVEWDNRTQTLMIENGYAKIVFTIGSEIAVVNGESKKIGAIPQIMDDQIMLPIRFASEALGANIIWNQAQSTAFVETYKKNSVVTKKTKSVKIPLQWEFSDDGDIEGWVPNSFLSSVKVKDGLLTAKSKGNDPVIISPVVSIDSADFNKIYIGMKNPTSSKSMQLFFITEDDTAWNTDKCIAATLKVNDQEIREYVLDMSKVKKWTGTVTKLRLDPISDSGNICIDYIRVMNE